MFWSRSHFMTARGGKFGAIVRANKGRLAIDAHQPGRGRMTSWLRSDLPTSMARLSHMLSSRTNSIFSGPPLASWLCTKSYVHMPLGAVELEVRMSLPQRRFLGRLLELVVRHTSTYPGKSAGSAFG